MGHLFTSETLPITTHEDGLEFDRSVFVISHEHSFKTRMLRNYYLNALTVFPKIIYKTYWVDDFYSNFQQGGLKMKVSVVFPDIVGIEFSKTKTVVSVDAPRLIECISGMGVAILQPPEPPLTEEMVPFIIDIFPGIKVAVPPHWGYTLVNIGREPLTTIELIHKDQPLHITYKERRGAPLYMIERNGSVEIVKNSQYKNVQKYVKLDSNDCVKKISIMDGPTVAHQVCEHGLCITWFEDKNIEWQDIMYSSVTGDPVSFNR
jgi:oxalate decarboxylase/phosphoglucose isomerase-like protein (cupin superfamily)